VQSRKVTGGPCFGNGETQASTSVGLLLAALLVKPFGGVAKQCLDLSKTVLKRRVLMVCGVKAGPQSTTLAKESAAVRPPCSGPWWWCFFFKGRDGGVPKSLA
jgi:hypothetical protein